MSRYPEANLAKLEYQYTAASHSGQKIAGQVRHVKYLHVSPESICLGVLHTACHQYTSVPDSIQASVTAILLTAEYLVSRGQSQLLESSTLAKEPRLALPIQISRRNHRYRNGSVEDFNAKHSLFCIFLSLVHWAFANGKQNPTFPISTVELWLFYFSIGYQLAPV